MHTFTVAGRGDFPFDMLRYDEAFPANTVDANAFRWLDYRTITLYSNKVPTPARWSSFGWTVTSFNSNPVADLRARG